MNDKKQNESIDLGTSKLPTTFTSSYKVGKRNLISDDELYYYLNSCPFFETYRDGEMGEVDTILLPLFRKYHLRKADGKAISFSTWTTIFQERITKCEIPKEEFKKTYKKLERYFLNFYTIFHPSKKYEIILPYFPYRYNHIMGCSEVVVRTNTGIRIYKYCFDDGDIKPADINYYGFQLQCAARVFHEQTGNKPASMALVYPATKAVVYYSYNESEQIDKMHDNKQMTRHYGEHCDICIRTGCKPMIDKHDKYGWRLTK